uniref:Uncharacterized protein n=1 Tax=Musa acuminata subsp. malaccensis TaxID=214687 RepID=A0A804KE27_MUSAM
MYLWYPRECSGQAKWCRRLLPIILAEKAISHD